MNRRYAFGHRFDRTLSGFRQYDSFCSNSSTLDGQMIAPALGALGIRDSGVSCRLYARGSGGSAPGIGYRPSLHNLWW